MTVIKINAITVPAGSGDELAHRFAARAVAVDGADGFEVSCCCDRPKGASSGW